MSNKIEGKVVVITGASVVLGARRLDSIWALADELTGEGGKALAVRTDVTRREQVQAFVDAAVQTYGQLPVALQVAGGTRFWVPTIRAKKS